MREGGCDFAVGAETQRFICVDVCDVESDGVNGLWLRDFQYEREKQIAAVIFLRCGSSYWNTN